MSVDPGTRLGPYEITAPLGAGGMGEVYIWLFDAAAGTGTRFSFDPADDAEPDVVSGRPRDRLPFES